MSDLTRAIEIFRKSVAEFIKMPVVYGGQSIELKLPAVVLYSKEQRQLTRPASRYETVDNVFTEIVEVSYLVDIQISFKDNSDNNTLEKLSLARDTLSRLTTGWNSDEFRKILEANKNEESDVDVSLMKVYNLRSAIDKSKDHSTRNYSGYNCDALLSVIDTHRSNTECITSDNAPEVKVTYLK